MSRCQDVLPNYKIFQHKMGGMMCDGHHNKRIDLLNVGFRRSGGQQSYFCVKPKESL